MTFRKKTYSLRRFAGDVTGLFGRLGELRRIQSGAAIDPAFREEIMVAVARANECRYCIFAHETAAREEGVAQATLDALARGELTATDLEPRVTVALEYASALAACDFGPVDPVLEGEVVALHGEDGRRTIETVARLMTVMNLTGNTVDALFSRLGGDPAPDSRICDELVLTYVWAWGAALTSLNLMRARDESPTRLFESFREFAAETEGA
ncbi:MAG: carboxymuconolactone decarboxylase family protein [Acidimicrobiia bacterium]|nr:carboxymuconolactone decarboxylase family protein [Acidimicrobiia bacterium]